MFKDIKCPILSIAESDETCTLLLNVHTKERTEKENEMISEAISKLIDLLLDVDEESHTFGDLMEPLSFSVVVNPEIVKELQKHEDEALKPHQFKIGDRVRIKTWEQMEKEYGLDEGGCINVHGHLCEPMKHLCGTFATIEEITGKRVVLSDFSAQGRTDFVITKDMIEPSPYFHGKVVCVDDKDEMFTKGNVYEIKDGVITNNAGTFNRIKSLNNLNERMDSKFVEVIDE